MIGKCQISVLDKHAIHALARGQTRAEFSTVRGAGVCGSVWLAWLVGGGLVKCGGSEDPSSCGPGDGRACGANVRYVQCGMCASARRAALYMEAADGRGGGSTSTWSESTSTGRFRSLPHGPPARSSRAAAAAEGGTGTRAIFSEKIRMKAALQSSSTCGEETSGRVTQEQGGRTGSGKRAWGGANRGTRSGGGTEEGARAHPVGRHVVGDVVQLAHARLDLGRGPLPPLKGARCT